MGGSGHAEDDAEESDGGASKARGPPARPRTVATATELRDPGRACAPSPRTTTRQEASASKRAGLRTACAKEEGCVHQPVHRSGA